MAILVHEFPDNGVSSADFNSVVSGAVKSSRDYSSSYTGSSGGSGTNDQGGSGTNDQGRSGTNDQGAVTPPAQKSSGKVTITLNGSASIQVRQGSTTTRGVFGAEKGGGGRRPAEVMPSFAR